MIDELLDRLVFLKYGLSIILGFIGIKLILEALHTNELPFINSGEPLNVPEVDVGESLIVILSVLTITVVASLLSPQGKVGSVVKSLHRAVDNYLREDFHPTKEDHAIVYDQIVKYETKMATLDEERVEKAIGSTNLRKELMLVHAKHAEEFGSA